MLSLEKLMEPSFKVPYDKSVKGKVVFEGTILHYKNKNGEDRSSKSVAVADESACVKCVCYEQKDFSKLVLGACLKLRNIIKRDGQIILTSTSRVFPVAAFDVPPTRAAEGKALVNPPPAAEVTLQAAVSSPPKAKVSVRAKVIQDEEEKEVDVKGTPTKLRNLYLQDETMAKVRVALWRDTCKEIHTGDHIKLTDVVINNYRDEVSLNTTYTTAVYKLDQPTTTVKVIVVGASCQETITELLLDNDNVQFVPTELLKDVLPEENQAYIEAFFTASGEVAMDITSKGSDVQSISLV